MKMESEKKAGALLSNFVGQSSFDFVLNVMESDMADKYFLKDLSRTAMWIRGCRKWKQISLEETDVVAWIGWSQWFWRRWTDLGYTCESGQVLLLGRCVKAHSIWVVTEQQGSTGRLL